MIWNYPRMKDMNRGKVLRLITGSRCSSFLFFRF